jgi:hypothetical protein
MASSQLDVQLDSLLPMAKGWDDQSVNMTKIVGEIGSAQISHATSIVSSYGGKSFSGVGISEDYPLFSSAFSTYAQVSSQYEKLCQEGAQMMEQIADALHKAYQNYQTAESANVASVNNVG